MSFLSNLKRTIITAQHLKPSQVLYRIAYALRPVKSLKKKPFNQDKEIDKDFGLPHSADSRQRIKVEGRRITVQLLNKQKTYLSQIDWSDQAFGRLWNYNLQYADFINQQDLPVDIREHFILNLYSWLYDGKLKPEPYPASLRIMNTIRFLQENMCSLKQGNHILDGLHSELHFLAGRIEYHLSGNHLLENAFAMMMGGSFLNQHQWFQIGRKILKRELEEQILADGAHYERSPMYHSIILYRVLEATSYLPEDDDLKRTLKKNATRMVAFLRNMRFSNESFAHFNDSTEGVAPGYKELLSLAEQCNVSPDFNLPLSESGFRRFNRSVYELIVDAEGIKPDHQPGHAHADSLSFILHIRKQPFIVDPAISTYEPGDRRNWERSSRAHNGVTVQDENYAEVWGTFRIGNRPEFTILKENKHSLHGKLKYNTATNLKIKQERLLTTKTNFIKIEDRIWPDIPATGRLHFFPSVFIKRIDDLSVSLSDNSVIRFNDPVEISQFSYHYNTGFNKQKEACGIRYQFKNRCSFEITPGQP